MPKVTLNIYDKKLRLDIKTSCFIVNRLSRMKYSNYRKDNILFITRKISSDICSNSEKVYSEEDINEWLNFLLGNYTTVSVVIDCLKIFKNNGKLEYLRKFKLSDRKTIQAFLASSLPKNELIFMVGSDSIVAKKIIEKKFNK